MGTLLRKLKNRFVIEKVTPIEIPIMEGQYLKGKTAFITGGTGGIGFSIANRFIENGARVIIAGRDETKLSNACEKLGHQAQYSVMDIGHPEEFEAIILKWTSEHNEKIDILVNCAGVHGSSNFWTVEPAEWDQVMNTNLRGMYFLGQVFGKYFRREGIQGHILNISSASALKRGKTPYEISKNGVKTITLGMAEEMIKYGIVVNCLAPGPTATSMIHMDNNSSLGWTDNPSGRVATPDEIANWAVLLASDIGSYVVGDSFYVTGGSGTIRE